MAKCHIFPAQFPPLSSTGEARRAGRTTTRSREISDPAGCDGRGRLMNLHATFRPEREENVAKAKPGLPNEGGDRGEGMSSTVFARHDRGCRSPAVRPTDRVCSARPCRQMVSKGECVSVARRPRPSNPGKGLYGTPLPHADVITSQGLPWCMFRAESRPGET